MKKSRFSEEKIIALLRAQDAGASTAEVCPSARGWMCFVFA